MDRKRSITTSPSRPRRRERHADSFVNGRIVSARSPYDKFKRSFDAELRKAKAVTDVPRDSLVPPARARTRSR